ncbi:hypothetical protein ABZ916_42870 [Streptomyces sp. NPDC046853]|uniref:hypothetical protein n=1 Tax=Streptomyces sp. NPDC046853 TaxID=3154920 RepID=UPI0033E728FE
MVLTIDLAVLLAIIIFLLWRRRPLARSRVDTGMTMAVVLVFGVLIAPTAFGHGIMNAVGDVAQGISNVGTNP